MSGIRVDFLVHYVAERSVFYHQAFLLSNRLQYPTAAHQNVVYPKLDYNTIYVGLPMRNARTALLWYYFLNTVKLCEIGGDNSKVMSCPGREGG